MDKCLTTVEIWRLLATATKFFCQSFSFQKHAPIDQSNTPLTTRMTLDDDIKLKKYYNKFMENSHDANRWLYNYF